MANSIETNQKGYCPFEFYPSEEAVMDFLRTNGKCYILYHLLGGLVEAREWVSNDTGKFGPRIFKYLGCNEFVKRQYNRIEKIIVMTNEMLK